MENRVSLNSGVLAGAPADREGSTASPPLDRRLAIAVGIGTLLAVLATLVVTFIYLGRQIAGPWDAVIEPVDRRIAYAVYSWRSVPMDRLMWSFTYLSEEIPMITICVGIFLYLIWQRRWRAFLCFLLTMPATAVMCDGTRHFVQRPRPDYWLIHEPGDLGFPSGHVMNAVIMAGVCIYGVSPYLKHRWQRVLLVLFWIVYINGMNLSRIYVGAHYPSDNLAGFTLGLLWVCTAVPVIRRTFPHVQDRPS